MNPWKCDDISNGPPQMYHSERIMFSLNEYDIKIPGKHFGLLGKIDPQFMHFLANQAPLWVHNQETNSCNLFLTDPVKLGQFLQTPLSVIT